jgi:hypothetical protein
MPLQSVERFPLLVEQFPGRINVEEIHIGNRIAVLRDSDVS